MKILNSKGGEIAPLRSVVTGPVCELLLHPVQVFEAQHQLGEAKRGISKWPSQLSFMRAFRGLRLSMLLLDEHRTQLQVVAETFEGRFQRMPLTEDPGRE